MTKRGRMLRKLDRKFKPVVERYQLDSAVFGSAVLMTNQMLWKMSKMFELQYFPKTIRSEWLNDFPGVQSTVTEVHEKYGRSEKLECLAEKYGS